MSDSYISDYTLLVKYTSGNTVHYIKQLFFRFIILIQNVSRVSYSKCDAIE